MQLYGYHLPTTPNLCADSEHALIFENAYCAATNTDPSLTALFSGKYPSITGVLNHGARVTSNEKRQAERQTYFTEVLRKNGYWTSAVDVSDRWHRKGFDEYIYQTRSNMYGFGSFGNDALDNLHVYDLFFSIVSQLIPARHLPPANLRAEDVTANALRLVRRFGERRNFLFVHYWDTHPPYTPPEELLDRFLIERELGALQGKTPADIVRSFKRPLLKPIDCAWLKRLPSIGYALASYDGAVANVDSEIAKFLREIRNTDQYDRTVVIVTADHGESLLEHGIFFDHHGLYDEVARVPLVMFFPNGLSIRPRRVTANVTHVDLFPTILEMAGVEFSHEGLSGKNLMTIITEEEPRERPILIEESHFERKRAVILGRHKFVEGLGDDITCRFCGLAHGDQKELFDLATDPHETMNLVSERPDILSELERWSRQGPSRTDTSPK